MTWAQTNKCYLPMIIKDWTNFSEIEAKALSHSKEETIKDEKVIEKLNYWHKVSS